MAKLVDALTYLLSQYPYPADQSNARVTKMLYLADWVHCLRHEMPITDIEWYFNNYGPFVDDVKETAIREKSLFDVVEVQNDFGKPKTVLKLKADSISPDLSVTEKQAIDHVIRVTKDMSWEKFIQTVYGTYPVATSPRYSVLDLETKAKQYKALELAAT